MVEKMISSVKLKQQTLKTQTQQEPSCFLGQLVRFRPSLCHVTQRYALESVVLRYRKRARTETKEQSARAEKLKSNI